MNAPASHPHDRGVVRVITCGSVDDGKSTLIGRLLFDTRAVLGDQLAALGRARHARVTAADAEIDLALLTDGLEAEREQGITIDVAYRYFSTAERKFIVADAPGHEQYTRNMVTGASQVDVAILLVDASRLPADGGPVKLLAQTKRHAAIVRLLGLRHVAVAVNKMDLFDYDEAHFRRIEAAVTALADTLQLPTPQVFPVSALLGDNIVTRSPRFHWYQGPSLLQWLESLDTTPHRPLQALRFPVQHVARQDGSSADDFRGYLGRVESGTLRTGQRVRILPGQAEATVTGIHLAQGAPQDATAPSQDSTPPPQASTALPQDSTTPPQGTTAPTETCPSAHPGDDGASSVRNTGLSSQARTGDVITLTLDRDLDISRGDMLVAADEPEPVLARQLLADLCWLDPEPLATTRKYVLRHGTSTVFARVKRIDRVLDIETLSHGVDAATLAMNAIGRVELSLQKPIVADTFEQSVATGAFVLIDEATHHTVAAGMIRQAA